MVAATDLSIPFEMRDLEYITHGKQHYGVLTIGSSDGSKEYRVDITNGRCSCKAWVFSRLNPSTGAKPPCKHLRQFGYTDGQ